MTGTPAPCATGCTTRGQHATACETDTCTGCLPRPATTGNLCHWCYRQLTERLAAAPDLVRHLRDIGAPHAHIAPPSDTRTYTDPAEGTVLPAAWTAADELHAMLASWALLILEEHPQGHAMVGPNEVGAWHTRYGTVVGIAHVNATRRLTDWLTPWLPWAAEQEWAAEMVREVRSVVDTTIARWPTATAVEPVKPVPMPCPRCDLMSLTYTPPTAPGDAFRVACGNPDCARVWSEDEWEWLVNMVIKGGKVGA